MLKKIFLLSDMKYNRRLPDIVKDMTNNFHSVVSEYDNRGLLNSTLCTSELLRTAIISLTQIAESRLHSDIDAIILSNRIICRPDVNQIMQRQHETIDGVLRGIITPILKQVIKDMTFYRDDLIDAITQGSSKVKLEARHNIECLILENEIANKGVAIAQIIISNYNFIADIAIRKNTANDVIELNNAILNKDYKSILTGCGSIAEALLLDALLQDETNAMNAQKKGTGAICKWKFEALINTTEELSIITNDIAYQVHLLRRNRNIIHPGNQVRNNMIAKPEDAGISINILRNLILSLGGHC